MNSLPRPVQRSVGEKLRIVLAPVTVPNRTIDGRACQFIHDRILGFLIENREITLHIDKAKQIVRIGNLPEMIGV